jgi:hypothetical protein
MLKVPPKLRAYLEGSGLALGILGHARVSGIAKAIFVPPWDSPAGGVLDIMMSSPPVYEVWGLAVGQRPIYFSVQPGLLPIRQPPCPVYDLPESLP